MGILVPIVAINTIKATNKAIQTTISFRNSVPPCLIWLLSELGTATDTSSIQNNYFRKKIGSNKTSLNHYGIFVCDSSLILNLAITSE